MLRWARTTVSVTYGVGTHPRGGRGAPAEKYLHDNPNLDTLRMACALSIRLVGDINIFLSIRSFGGRAADRFNVSLSSEGKS